MTCVLFIDLYPYDSHLPHYQSAEESHNMISVTRTYAQRYQCHLNPPTSHHGPTRLSLSVSSSCVKSQPC